MSPKVSVLTPVYNVADYLPQCLDSLKAQTLEDIEFICINDGSTDSSPEILQRYAAGDARFKIIDKQNEGYGKSMNRGIAAAKGEYIGILESDDFIAPDAFERLYALAKANGDCDVVKANYYTFDGEHGERFVENLPADLCGRAIDPSRPENAQVVIPTPAIWSALYRRSFLQENGIGFLETPGAGFQDTGFVMKCFIAARKVYLTQDAFIRYRVDNSGSSVKSKSKVFNVCEEYHSIEAFLAERPEKRAALIACVNAAKFNTYRWNKNRIAWDLRPEFLEVFAREFRQARDAGELDESLSVPSRWKEFNEIAEDPKGYYLRTRAAAAYKRLARKMVGAAAPQVSFVVMPNAPALELWRVFKSVGRQLPIASRIVLPASLTSGLDIDFEQDGIVHVLDEARPEAYLEAALSEVRTPYTVVVDTPVYFQKGALGKLVSALEGSPAGFAVAPLERPVSGGMRELETSEFLFDPSSAARLHALGGLDPILGDKLFRTDALGGWGSRLDSANAYGALAFELVPDARALTSLDEKDLVGRAPFAARIHYRRWLRKNGS